MDGIETRKALNKARKEVSKALLLDDEIKNAMAVVADLIPAVKTRLAEDVAAIQWETPPSYDEWMSGFAVRAAETVGEAVRNAMREAAGELNAKFDEREAVHQAAVELRHAAMAELMKNQDAALDLVKKVAERLDKQSSLSNEVLADNERLAGELAEETSQLLEARHELRKYREFIAECAKKQGRIETAMIARDAKKLPPEQDQAALRSINDLSINLLRFVRSFVQTKPKEVVEVPAKPTAVETPAVEPAGTQASDKSEVISVGLPAPLLP